MDLKTFVETTLYEIVQGVADSQAKVAALGGAVNPSGSLSQQHPSLMGFTATDQRFYAVSFDVAVTAASEVGGTGGAKLQVASFISIGGSAEAKATSQSLSRVQFVVPLAFPIDAVTEAARRDKKAADDAGVQKQRTSGNMYGGT